MWIKTDKGLIQSTDDSRVKFTTTVSKEVILLLRALGEENSSNASYLLETAFAAMLEDVSLSLTKTKGVHRRSFRTTCDKDLLEKVRELAKKQNVGFNDLIEQSVEHINPEAAKKNNHRYRIE